MSDEVKKIKKVTRVALPPCVIEILEKWKAQLRESYPAFSPSERDLVEWAVASIPVLSVKDKLDIKRRYFDEVKELEYLLSELRKARAIGDKASEENLLAQILICRKSEQSPKRHKKSTPIGASSHKEPAAGTL